MPDIDKVIDLSACPLADEGFITACRDQLDRDGVVTIPGFLREAAREALVAEAEAELPGGGIVIFKVRAWDYPALLLTYERAVKVCRDRHVPVLVHVEECTQPQGHSTSGSHERYKTPERLAWAEEFDGIRQLSRFLVMEGAATEEELKAIRKEAKKAVLAEQKAAWAAVRQALDGERDTAVELLRAVPNPAERAEARA